MTLSFGARGTDPVAAADVKTLLKITGSDEDTLLGVLIDVATDMVEREIGKTLIERTITATYDTWELHSQHVELFFGPVQSVTSVKGYDVDGNTTTVGSANYYLNGDFLVGQDEGFMSEVGRTYKALEVVYVAGYGDEVGDVPEVLKDGVRRCVADLYETRQGITAVNERVKENVGGWRDVVATHKRTVVL